MTQIYLRPIIAYILITIFVICASIVALFFQFDYHELPCPLCLLQRFGFFGMGLGAMLSIRRGVSWKYDLIILFLSLYTLLAGLRQILLHITPHDNGYGSSFLGLHFYTWSVITSFAVILCIALMPLIDLIIKKIIPNIYLPSFFIKALNIILMIILIINIISTYLECGFTQCPDNPIKYIKIND